MKKTKLQALLFFMAVGSIISCSDPSTKKQYTEQDYKDAIAHMSRDLNGLVYNQVSSENWIGDSYVIYSTNTKDGTNFIIVNTETKEKEVAFENDKLAESLSKLTGKEVKASDLGISNVTLSEDLKTLYFNVGRTAYTCNLSDYNVAEKKSEQAARNRNEFISPNGKLAAYIDNYNLWVRDVKTNKKTQLTFDGIEDFGYATNNAGWTKSDGPVLKWSPNSDKIATFQQDSRGVGNMYLTSTNVGPPELVAFDRPSP